MADAEERVRIELVDAGGHKDRVVMVLSKVKGLTMPAEQLVLHIPCTVATDVPLSLAQKLKAYLEKAGAMVMLEREQGEEEEELFTVAEFPIAAERDADAALFGMPDPDGADDGFGFEAAPAPDMGAVPDFETADDLAFETDDIEPPPEFPHDERPMPDAGSKGGIFGKFMNALPAIGKKKTAATPDADDARDAAPPRTSPWAFLEKFRKPSGAPDAPEKHAAPGADEPDQPARKSRPDFLTSPLAYILVGALAGAILAGSWGSWGIRNQRQKLIDYEEQTAREIEAHSAQLKQLVVQLTADVESLQHDKSALQAELAQAGPRTAGGAATSALEPTPWEAALIRDFQARMERDAQLLEAGYAAQQQAGCAQQVLLDGKGTLTYAQVVKQFSARYTRHDIRRSASLATPYVAEFKIPFQQTLRAGATLSACEDAALQGAALPDHHEFGGYFGYWTLEYAYVNGDWVLNTTVSERNRDLYESAFQKGSPDYAKFSIDRAAFPGLGE